MAQYDLERFVAAQNSVYPTVLKELQNGYKATHWIWFIFPQLKDLGRSSTALFYGIADLEEAKQYLAHPVLGPRLLECIQTVLQHRGTDVFDIFGGTDAVKLRSCMTLFREAATDPGCFDEVINLFYNGRPDPKTLKLLEHK